MCMHVRISLIRKGVLLWGIVISGEVCVHEEKLGLFVCFLFVWLFVSCCFRCLGVFACSGFCFCLGEEGGRLREGSDNFSRHKSTASVLFLCRSQYLFPWKSFYLSRRTFRSFRRHFTGWDGVSQIDESGKLGAYRPCKACRWSSRLEEISGRYTGEGVKDEMRGYGK